MNRAECAKRHGATPKQALVEMMPRPFALRKQNLYGLPNTCTQYGSPFLFFATATPISVYSACRMFSR